MTEPTPGSIVASAPGRVNLMGDHTDYNQGLVLPMPIPQRTTVSIVRRVDARIVVWSEALCARASYTLGEEQPRNQWIDYVQGVTHILSREGHALAGFDASISTTVPLGAGLSSSASVSVALLRALRTAFALSLDNLELARLARAAEAEFVGVPVGVMDPMVVSLGNAGEALFIDTQTLQTLAVPIPAKLEVVVIDSGVAHELGTGEYRKRRDECGAAAQQLGVRSLRDLDAAQEPKVRELEPVLQRRVRHVLSENERVRQTLSALQHADTSQLGVLFSGSHASLRDDYEVSVREIDQLVEIASRQPGILGARMTGGGFGGSVVMFAWRGRGATAAQNIAARYALESTRTPRILLP